MKFYRLAETSDFLNYEKESDIPKEIRAFLKETYDVKKAAQEYQRMFGCSAVHAKNVCTGYLTFLTAQGDFEQGKAVYTEY